MKPHNDQPDFAASLRAFLSDQIATIGTQRQLILDSTDPEGVHRLRIALRRLRSVLRAVGFGGGHVEKDARWLTRELGAVRDLDVLLARYADTDAQPDYLAYLQEQWRQKRTHLKGTLTGKRYAAFARALTAFEQDLAPFGLSAQAAAEKFIGRELARTKRRGRQISTASPDRDVHKLRLQCKRLRYLVEMVERYAGISLGNFKKHARALQELLGEFVDERTAALAVADYAAHLTVTEASRDVLVACGKQIKSHELAAAEHRRHLPQVWSEFDATCTQKSLRAELQKR